MLNVEAELSGLRALDNLQASLDKGLENAVERCAVVVLQSKVRELGNTYKRSIPTRAQVAAERQAKRVGRKFRIAKKRIGIASANTSGRGGEPAWKRSGDWLEGQVIERPSRFMREVTTSGPATVYDARLANLPVGALGVNRSNPVAENAVRKTMPQLRALAEAEIRNALGL